MGWKMLEKLVTSREASQKLKDLGVLQMSYFRWELRASVWSLCPGCVDNCRYADANDSVSAFTCTELAAMRGLQFLGLEACVIPDIEALAIIQSIQNKCLIIEAINANIERFWEVKS